MSSFICCQNTRKISLQRYWPDKLHSANRPLHQNSQFFKMRVFGRSTSFRQALTASRNKALPGKKKKKSRTSNNYKPANVLRCVYDRIYVKLSHSVNKLYGYVLQCRHLFLHWLTSHAQGSQGETRAHARDSEATRREEISSDPLASRVRVFCPLFCLSAKVPTPRSLIGEK